jgi:hypothetical protein
LYLWTGKPWALDRSTLGKLVHRSGCCRNWLEKTCVPPVGSGCPKPAERYKPKVRKSSTSADHFQTIPTALRSFPRWPVAEISLLLLSAGSCSCMEPSSGLSVRCPCPTNVSLRQATSCHPGILHHRDCKLMPVRSLFRHLFTIATLAKAEDKFCKRFARPFGHSGTSGAFCTF